MSDMDYKDFIITNLKKHIALLENELEDKYENIKYLNEYIKRLGDKDKAFEIIIKNQETVIKNQETIIKCLDKDSTYTEK